jgi:hypothetical protein
MRRGNAKKIARMRPRFPFRKLLAILELTRIQDIHGTTPNMKTSEMMIIGETSASKNFEEGKS